VCECVGVDFQDEDRRTIFRQTPSSIHLAPNSRRNRRLIGFISGLQKKRGRRRLLAGDQVDNELRCFGGEGSARKSFRFRTRIDPSDASDARGTQCVTCSCLVRSRDGPRDERRDRETSPSALALVVAEGEVPSPFSSPEQRIVAGEASPRPPRHPPRGFLRRSSVGWGRGRGLVPEQVCGVPRQRRQRPCSWKGIADPRFGEEPSRRDRGRRLHNVLREEQDAGVRREVRPSRKVHLCGKTHGRGGPRRVAVRPAEGAGRLELISSYTRREL